jgi:hypothetical protein
MLRYFVAACAGAALVVTSLVVTSAFLAGVGPIWP